MQIFFEERPTGSRQVVAKLIVKLRELEKLCARHCVEDSRESLADMLDKSVDVVMMINLLCNIYRHDLRESVDVKVSKIGEK